MDILIQAALPRQAAALSEIALKAKAHWGYSAEQLERWRTAFLTITPDYIEVNRVWVAVTDTQQTAGFAAVVLHGDEAVLDHLWVLPDYIGRGVGTRLFLHVAATVAEFVFTSDPHADEFYRKMDAQTIGDYYSVLQERTLTRFRYTSKIE